ncbi:hypothetical protein NMG60_11009621 [Bertholletia excelsa]
MGISSCRTFVLFLLCFGILSVQPEKVSCLRSIEPLFLRNSRVLNAAEVLKIPPSLAPVPSVAFDPNQSSKRNVRRGSDPIHNRW